jgi:isopentenyl diphosphate isomerase/L-lactate dehydrogenase-like FMN-dependent dehydrogenase
MPALEITAARASRRAFLRFVAGSPLWLSSPILLDGLLAGIARAEADVPGAGEWIASAADAVNVFDFRVVAERKLLPAHYAYLDMGVEHEVTLAENRRAFAGHQLRPRRLVDVRDLDTRTRVLGTELSCPILLAPVGSQRMYHADAELAVARAAKRRDHLQILSMGSSTPLAEVAEARGAPVWFQLYASRFAPATRHFLREAEAADCTTVVLTVDIVGLPAGRERIARFRRADNPDCQSCHASFGASLLRGALGAANAVGLDPVRAFSDLLVLDWESVDRIRDATSMKLVIKGILTGEDAALCVEHGADAIIVSNHGGRAEDNGLATIDVLAEVVAAVAGRVPVLIDSGFRRGTDVFKALALGAAAVCVGRPYVWGLAAFGEDGVAAVLAILRRELETIMRQMGTRDLAAIGAGHVRRAGSPEPDR